MPTKRHINKRRGTTRDRLLTLARRRGVLRPRDLKPHGLSRETLRRLTAAGGPERRGPGPDVPARAALRERATVAGGRGPRPHRVRWLVSPRRLPALNTQHPA